MGLTDGTSGFPAESVTLRDQWGVLNVCGVDAGFLPDAVVDDVLQQDRFA